MALPEFGYVAERLRRSTVVVSTDKRGAASGLICSEDGCIVTSAHVLASGRVRTTIWDGRDLEAKISQVDRVRDLAELRVSARALPAAAFADSGRVRAGELALAIGNPLGFVGALSTGVVHTVDTLPGLGSATWVQANLRLAPGNSGGPMANAAGEVIGINAMMAGRLALAVPSNAVKHFLASGSSSLWFGALLSPVEIPLQGGAKQFALLIAEIVPHGPAALASLRAGDILVGSADRKFAGVEDFRGLLNGNGERQLRLEFLRGDYHRIRKVTVLLELANRPSRVRAA
jgi:serine protease Do